MKHIETLVDEGGQISIGKLPPFDCVAAASDDHNCLAMLVRRDGESLTALHCSSAWIRPSKRLGPATCSSTKSTTSSTRTRVTPVKTGSPAAYGVQISVATYLVGFVRCRKAC
jgi:hypothetical protein